MPLLDVDICDLNIAHTESQGVQQSLNLTQTWLAMCNNKKTECGLASNNTTAKSKGSQACRGKKYIHHSSPCNQRHIYLHDFWQFSIE